MSEKPGVQTGWRVEPYAGSLIVGRRRLRRWPISGLGDRRQHDVQCPIDSAGPGAGQRCRCCSPEDASTGAVPGSRRRRFPPRANRWVSPTSARSRAVPEGPMPGRSSGSDLRATTPISIEVTTTVRSGLVAKETRRPTARSLRGFAADFPNAAHGMSLAGYLPDILVRAANSAPASGSKTTNGLFFRGSDAPFGPNQK